MKQATKKIFSIGCIVISLLFFAAFLSIVEGSGVSSVATVTVGGNPFGAAITPDGKYAYIANNLENVSVIDTATNKVVATVATEKGLSIVITPDGKYAYVTNWEGVSVISTATNTVVDTIAIGDPSNGNSPNGGIAITYDGKYVYLTMPDSVAVINTETNTVTANITITPKNSNANVNGVTLFSYSDPIAVAVSPDDAYAYVGTGAGDSRVILLDTSTNKIVNSITIGSDGIEDIAVTPDGKYVYATDVDGNISVIDTATFTVDTTLTGFGAPVGLAITSDGKYAYVVNGFNATVSVLNTATKVVDGTVSVGQSPRGLAFTPDGKYAYVICDTSTDYANSPGANYDGTVSVINTATNSAPTDSSIPTTTVPTASSSPAVPEFPSLLFIIPLIVSLFAVAAMLRHKKKPSQESLTKYWELVSQRMLINAHISFKRSNYKLERWMV